MVHRRGPAHRFFNQSGNQSGIILQFVELPHAFTQRPEAPGDRRRGRIVTRGRDDHVVADRFEIVDRFAVNPGIGDYACKVVLRLVAAPLHQRDKISLKFTEQPKQFPGVPGRIDGGGLAASQVLILTGEELLGQLEHLRFILFRNPKDLHENV